jgi:hypothetical protein
MTQWQCQVCNTLYDNEHTDTKGSVERQGHVLGTGSGSHFVPTSKINCSICGAYVDGFKVLSP